MILAVVLFALRPLQPAGAWYGESRRVCASAVCTETTSCAANLTDHAETHSVARRRYVLWPRIDQKTCLKAVVSAGLEAVPLALAAAGDELRTNVAALEAELMRLGPANVVAVVTTTSCFAPRAADDIVAVRHSIVLVCKRVGW